MAAVKSSMLPVVIDCFPGVEVPELVCREDFAVLDFTLGR